MRNKICLLGMKDIQDFLSIIKDVDGKIEVFNPNTGYRVSGRSMLGLIIATSEWGGETWIESEVDIYDNIEKYIVISDNDAANIHN